MNATSITRFTIAASAVAVVIAGGLWSQPAEAQMFREPFAFGARNAAGMAVFMRQRADNQNGATAAAVAPGESLTVACAGAGETTASAAGNILCVVAGDGTTVLVNGNQDANGNQTADANTNQTAAEQIQNILDGDQDD